MSATTDTAVLSALATSIATSRCRRWNVATPMSSLVCAVASPSDSLMITIFPPPLTRPSGMIRTSNSCGAPCVNGAGSFTSPTSSSAPFVIRALASRA